MIYSRFTLVFAILALSFATTNAQKGTPDKKTQKLMVEALDEAFGKHSNPDFKEVLNLPATEEHHPLQIFEFTDTGTNQSTGWVCLSEGLGRYDTFDYLVVYDNTRTIALVKISAYRSSHGYQITSKKWLSKFKGVKASEKIEIGKEVDAISGATLSSFGLVKSLNQVNEAVNKL